MTDDRQATGRYSPAASAVSPLSSALCLLIAFLPVMVVSARGEDMKYPAFEGQWRRTTAGGTGGNSWDPTKPIGLGQQAPLTSEYESIFEAGLNAQKTGVQGNTLGSTCLLPGMPKVMNFSEPMEIIMRAAITYFVPLRYPTRRIYTDGRSWPADEPPTLGGYSIGRWIDEDGDGAYDVLQVETRNFKGPRVYESSGLPLHADNQTIVIERLYLDKNDKNALHDEITTIDHALTRPWTIDRVVVREPVPVWVENSCHEANLHVRIGKDEYFLSADNMLMPVAAGQQPPDLSYFQPFSK
jgi:hypothetical protein